MHTYKVYEEGKVIFIGNSKELKKRFGLRKDASMGSYVTRNGNYKIKGKYDVEICEDVHRKPKHDADWETLRMMLVVRKEKLTSTAKDPHKYVDRLRDLGVEVKITPYISYPIIESDLTNPKQDRKQQRCWYVERL